MSEYIAIDVGAESGRLVRGTLDGGKLTLEEASRFPNGMIRMEGRLCWNLDGLFAEMKRAMRSLAKHASPESVGVDAWGVDFVLLAADGSPAGPPVAYRDSRTDGMMEKFFERVPRDEIYRRTGIQFMQINTLYQLFAMAEQKSPQLETAKDLLFIPDYFNHLFTGEKCSEFTNASTSQMMNIHEKTWDAELIAATGAPPALLQRLVPPGTAVGLLTDKICGETGLGKIPVIAPATHDTGSAIAAAPAEGRGWAYISSGTWSLMGIEVKEPIVNPEALKFNFTNEGGVNGTHRFLKNILGMWPVQRLRSEFDVKYDYGELMKMAAEADAFASLMCFEDQRFFGTAPMAGAIAGYCGETGQRAPQTPGAFVRCSLESLALQYRVVLEELRGVQSAPIDRIHVLGGGSRNAFLCRMTADATGLPVLAGPAEATALGNIIVQALALGHIASLEEARAAVRRSNEIIEYKPRDTDAWDAAFEKYQSLRNRCSCK
jgi:rhamnulokinase